MVPHGDLPVLCASSWGNICSRYDIIAEETAGDDLRLALDYAGAVLFRHAHIDASSSFYFSFGEP